MPGLGPVHPKPAPRSCVPPSSAALRRPCLCHQGFQLEGETTPPARVLTIGTALRLSASSRAGRPPAKRHSLLPAGCGSQCPLPQQPLPPAGAPPLPQAEAKGPPPPASQDRPDSKCSPSALQPVSQLWSGCDPTMRPPQASTPQVHQRKGCIPGPRTHQATARPGNRPVGSVFSPSPSLRFPTSDSGDTPEEAVTTRPGPRCPQANIA
ncbi:hypothetical protein NDU88_011165 [Pleurodeles waltl]|uniref:Uncharacterized protein n=1 Tax=Pleurodeles waltl TaxID=8319 RepID=A0AAV7S345_PLEWA|nr:hypothetical protein NDU88_011165 [Pleurodeles waltl]